MIRQWRMEVEIHSVIEFDIAGTTEIIERYAELIYNVFGYLDY